MPQKKATRSSRPATRAGRPKGGRRDAIALLKADHERVSRLFRRYEQLGERAVKGRKQTVDRIVKELSVHAAIEEQLLYPVMRRTVPQGERRVEHAIDEHQEVKELLNKLAKMKGDEPELDGMMHGLIGDVEEHVREEEKELFPLLRKAVGRDDLVKMADSMRLMKAVAPTRPHPRAPSRPPANVVAGLVAGIVDRARDVVRNR